MKKVLMGLLMSLFFAGVAFAATFDAAALHANERAAGSAMGRLIDVLGHAELAKPLFKADTSFSIEAYIRAMGPSATAEQILAAKQRYAENVAYYAGILARAERLRTARSANATNHLMTAWAAAGQAAKAAGDQLGQRAEFEKVLGSDEALKGLMKDSEPQAGAISPTSAIAAAGTSLAAPLEGSWVALVVRPSLVLVVMPT